MKDRRPRDSQYSRCRWPPRRPQCRRRSIRLRPPTGQCKLCQRRRRHRNSFARQERSQVLHTGVVTHQDHRMEIIGQFSHDIEDLLGGRGVQASVDLGRRGYVDLRRRDVPGAARPTSGGYQGEVDATYARVQPSPRFRSLPSAAPGQRPVDVDLACRPIRLRMAQQDQCSLRGIRAHWSHHPPPARGAPGVCAVR
jgi:hypothetical protein